MTAGRLLLLPSLLADAPADAVLPAGVIAAAHATRHFLAERAKSTRAYLKAIGHPLALQELDIVEIGHTPDPARIDAWLQPLCLGRDVALVAEAGCPAVADPGASVVARAHELGFAVRPLVGPSSILLALMASGLEGQRFRFVGYLPQDPVRRAQAISELEADSRRGETQLFIETPYRNQRLFEALLRHCAADTRLTVAVALTAADESVVTRPVAAWRDLDAARRPVLHQRPAVFAMLGSPRAQVRTRRRASAAA
jgi:16S rRNA (cytidine1402-2'-O)-methyltransferase